MSVLSRVKESSRRALREAQAAWSRYATQPHAEGAQSALEARLRQIQPGLKDTPLGSILQRNPVGDGAESTVYPIVRNAPGQPVLQARKMVDPDGVFDLPLAQDRINVLRSIKGQYRPLRIAGATSNLPTSMLRDTRSAAQRYLFAQPQSDLSTIRPGSDVTFWNQEFVSGRPTPGMPSFEVTDANGIQRQVRDLHAGNVRTPGIAADPVIVDPMFTVPGKDLVARKNAAGHPNLMRAGRRQPGSNPNSEEARQPWTDELVPMAFGKRKAGQHAPIHPDGVAPARFTQAEVDQYMANLSAPTGRAQRKPQLADSFFNDAPQPQRQPAVDGTALFNPRNNPFNRGNS